MPWLLAFEDVFQVGDYHIAEAVANLIEVAAVVAIAGAVAAAIVKASFVGVRSGWNDAFIVFKQYMGRGLLIGLDLLIAGDIIKTVTVEPTLENAAVLGLLVVIRTFLSWTIVLEVSGYWPWQHARNRASDGEEL